LITGEMGAPQGQRQRR